MDVITGKDDLKLHEGNFYLQKGDFKRAIKSYKNGLKLNSGNLVILYEIGLAYSKLQKQEKALKYWKKAIRIAPQSYIGNKVKEECDEISKKPRWFGCLTNKRKK